MLIRNFIAGTITGSILLCSGCAPSSMFSQEGGVAGLIMSGVGAGAGYAVGNQIGKKTENTLLGAGTGAALGLMAGGLLHEQNLRTAKARAVVVREARMIDSNQKEIDDLRERVTESTRWGGNEVRSWNDRYLDEEPANPYQGAVSRP